MALADPRRQRLYEYLHRIVYRNQPLTSFQHDDLCAAVEGFGAVTPTQQELAYIAKVYQERQARSRDGAKPFKATTVTKLYGQAAFMPPRRGEPPSEQVTDEAFFDIVLGKDRSP